MPTDTERREVAERLRVYSHDFDFGDANPFWYVAKAAFGDVDAHTYHSVFARLADLIDPTCHPVPSDGGFFTCSECRERIGAVLAALGTVLMHHCSHCGARVTSGGER